MRGGIGWEGGGGENLLQKPRENLDVSELMIGMREC